jgi:hypothetical protein
VLGFSEDLGPGEVMRNDINVNAAVDFNQGPSALKARVHNIIHGPDANC